MFEAYTQASQESCVPAPDMYGSPCHLTIDTTSFAVDWSTTPSSASPLSSIPGTPQTYPTVHEGAILDSNCFLGDVFSPSAEFLPQHQPGVETQIFQHSYCDPASVDVGSLCGAYGSPAQQEFTGPAKGDDFSAYYGRSTLDPVDAGFAPPPYMTLQTTFAI